MTDGTTFSPEGGQAAVDRVIGALRDLLATFGDDHVNVDAAASARLAQFLDGVNRLEAYQLLAHLAMAVRWASHASGRSEAEVVQILERKNESDFK